MEIQYKSNSNVLYCGKYHVVWCPKYRRPLPGGKVEKRLRTIIRQVAKERKAEIREMEAIPDHVHLLVEVDPQYGIHRLIRNIKGRSSRMLRGEVKPLRTRVPSLWTNSYFLSTVGGAPLKTIKQYIEAQKHV